MMGPLLEPRCSLLGNGKEVVEEKVRKIIERLWFNLGRCWLELEPPFHVHFHYVHAP
jgi:hypothetical protein